MIKTHQQQQHECNRRNAADESDSPHSGRAQNIKKIVAH